MELEPLNPIVLDQVPRLSRAQFALGRVDRGEGDQNVGMLGRQFRHFLVLVAAIAGLALGIDGEDHRRDVLLAVMRRRLLDGGRMLPRRAKVLGHRGLQIVVAVVGMAAAGLFRVGVEIDGTDFG